MFRVLVTSSLDGPEVAINAVGIPRIWTPYVPPSGVFDLGSWCRNVAASPTDSAYVWEVTCTYSSKMEKGDKRPDQQAQNPTLRPPDVTLGTNRVSVPMYFDVLGYAIVNSAGEPFDPPIMYDEKRITIAVSKNMAQYNQGYYTSFMDTINADRWMGFLRGEVKCVDVSASLQWEGSFAYWRVSFKFEAKRANIPKKVVWGNKKNLIGKRIEQSWTDFILDRGYREIYTNEADEKKLRPIMNADGMGTVSTPALLNGKGQAILRPMEKRVTNSEDTDDEEELADLIEEDEDVEYTDDENSPFTIDHSGPFTVDWSEGIADDTGASGTTDRDPVFIAYHRFPLRKFSALGLF